MKSNLILVCERDERFLPLRTLMGKRILTGLTGFSRWTGYRRIDPVDPENPVHPVKKQTNGMAERIRTGSTYTQMLHEFSREGYKFLILQPLV